MNRFPLTIGLILSLTSYSAWAQTCTWDGSLSSRWLDLGPGPAFDSNWTCSVLDRRLPTSEDDVFIGPNVNSPVADGPAAQSTNNLQLAALASLRIETSTVTVTGSTLTNDGLIIVDDGGILSIAGGATVDSIIAGEIELRGGEIDGTLNDAPVSFNGTHIIGGEGAIDTRFVNNTTITARDTTTDGTGTLRVRDPEAGAAGPTRTNNGVIQSSADAELTLTLHLLQTASGRVIADGSNVSLTTSRIVGGSLEAVNGGEFEAGNGSLVLDGVHLTGPLTKFAETTASDLVIENNTFINDGTITMGRDDNEAAFFDFSTSETVAGTGEIILLTESLGGNGSRIRSFGGAVGTMGAGQTVRGVGVISAELINNGTIIAEPRIGTVLALTSDGNPKTNNNVIQADAGATLRIRGTTVTQNGANGQLLANEGIVQLDAGTIVGGRLEAAGAGRFEIRDTFTSGRLENVTNNAPFDVPSGNNFLRLSGSSLNNNNTITVNSDGGGGFPQIIVDESISLEGSGEIVLNRAGLSSQFVTEVGVVATQTATHTIRGPGRITGDGKFVNNGRLEGDSAAEPLEIRTTRLEGNGVMKDVTIGFVATHAPGESTGIVPLEGSYSISSTSARLEIELGGLTPGTEHDQLSSTGTVDLAGTLDVLTLDAGSYVPVAGDRFEIINSTSPITGVFGAVNFPDIGFARTLTWQPVDYSTDPNKVFLEIAAVDFLAADFDEDGDVDNDDLAKWESDYGGPGSDADGDGDSDGADFLIWQRQFGLGVTPLSASQAVPEPGTFALLLLGSLSFSLCGYRRCK